MLCNVCLQCLSGYEDSSQVEYIGIRSSDWGVTKTVDSSFLDTTVNAKPLECPEYVFGHHISPQSWWQAKINGCDICATLDVDVYATQDVTSFGYFTMFGMEVMDSESASRSAHVILWIYYLHKRRKVNFKGRQQDLHAALESSTADIGTWSLIESWLNGCNEYHCSCNVQQHFIPARLLKRDTLGGVNTFRLVSRDSIEARDSYATLSHCWGKKTWDPSLILTRLTWDALSKGKAIDALPKTFKDAFVILERLGLQYIWIDRFCILQDSEDDWRQQAAEMHQVYKGSYVCIAALDARDDDGGCFFTRNTDAVKPLVVELPVKGTCQTALYVGGWDIKRREDASFSPAVIRQRAWVLQERVLSPRTIYWGRQQVHWECKEMHCSETQPDIENVYWYFKYHRAVDSQRQPMFKRLIMSYASGFEDPDLPHYEDWYSLLADYAVCQMTKPSDKLVAISAVAKEMQKHLSDVGEPTTYLAGLWGARLPQALIWYIEPSSVQRSRPRSFRAPSWSWAAVDGQLIHRDETFDFESPFARVVRAETTTPTGDETGQVTGGSITLESMLLLLTARFGAPTGHSASSCLDIASIKASGENHAPVRFGSDPDADASGNVYFDTLEDVGYEVQFMPVTTQAGSDHFTYGLALVGHGEVFKRVGHVVINLHWEEMLPSWNTWLRELPRHVIDIE